MYFYMHSLELFAYYKYFYMHFLELFSYPLHLYLYISVYSLLYIPTFLNIK